MWKALDFYSIPFQELHHHQQELQYQQEQQRLRYQLLSESAANQEQDEAVKNKLQHGEGFNSDHYHALQLQQLQQQKLLQQQMQLQQQQQLQRQQQQQHQQQQQQANATAERRKSSLAKRLQQEESGVHYSSSDGSTGNSPMMRIVGDRRQHYRAANPHYINTHQPFLHHPSHAQYPLQYSHGRCLENHHWEIVSNEKPYEDPRYQPEFMSSFGNGGRLRSSSNRSRHQGRRRPIITLFLCELWQIIEKSTIERKFPS